MEFTATIAQLQQIIGLRDTIHTCARTHPALIAGCPLAATQRYAEDSSSRKPWRTPQKATPGYAQSQVTP
jgi:hypothetical protein